jgi:hypothetical protein
LYIGELKTTDVKPADAPKIISASSNSQYLRRSLPMLIDEPLDSSLAG